MPRKANNHDKGAYDGGKKFVKNNSLQLKSDPHVRKASGV